MRLRGLVALAGLGVALAGCSRDGAPPAAAPDPAAQADPATPAGEGPADGAGEADGRRCSSVAACTRTLESARDREGARAAALALAGSGDDTAIEALVQWLCRADALAKLDDLGTPSVKTRNLHDVLAAWQARPTAGTEAQALRLGRDPVFLADDDRRAPLLAVLAAVRPMGEPTVAYFEETNALGYATSNALLLAENGSPRALALYRRMLADPAIDAATRVDVLHQSLLPRRVDPAIVDLAEQLLGDPLEPAVVVGLVETLFDHRSREWFGPARTPPQPPPWSSGATETLEQLVRLADRALRLPSVRGPLRDAVSSARAAIRTELAGR